MITGISIENFKGIREKVEIELRPITLLFGPNSAGKSSILHALQLAHEVFLRNNPNPDATFIGGGNINLGGFRTFVHNRALETPVRIGFKIHLDNPDVFLASAQKEAVERYLSSTSGYEGVFDCFGSFYEAEIVVEIRWSELRGAYVSAFRLIVEEELLAEITMDHPDGQQVLRINSAHRDLWRFSDGENTNPSHATTADVEAAIANAGTMDYTLLSVCLDALPPLVQAVPRPGGLRSPWYSFFLDKMTSVIPVSQTRLPFIWKILDSDEYDRAREQFQDVLGGGSILRFLGEVLDGISQLIAVPLAEVVEFLESFRSLGPIREVPRRIHESPSLPDASRWSSGLGAWDRLQTADASFINEVSDWLGDVDRLNSGFRIHLKRFKELDLSDPLVVQLLTGRAFDEAESSARIDLKSLPTHSRLVISPVDSSLELRPNDLGVGISQVVPVIVSALDGSRRLIAIEQPELHLHPKLQAELGDLFIEAALGGRRHSVILETHSELIPLRLMRRIRETHDGARSSDSAPITADDVAIYFIETFKGKTVTTHLTLSQQGQLLDPWPDGFFEEGFRERFSE
jgi:hypothetical protein